MAQNRGYIENEEQYSALREKGMSKQKAARIANSSKIDYNSTPYEERTKAELYQKAKEIGIDGRSKMNKKELIKALRKN